jgi:ribonuclease-3
MDPARGGDLARLEAALGHVFGDRGLLLLALTHVGAAPGRHATYQRLEFLGDRVLGVCVSSMLYEAFPDADEGQLSRRLADLVRRETCAEVALGWDVEPYIRLGPGEKTLATLRQAILGDICESLIGAVFLDGGFDAARALVKRAFESRMRAPNRPLRDPKTTLQEWAQARALPAPTYRERARSGPDHAPVFLVAVHVEGHAEIEAKGSSKRIAEQAAAAAFIAREKIVALR